MSHALKLIVTIGNLKSWRENISPPTGGTNNPPSSMLTGTGESTRIELTSPGTCSVPSTTDPLRPMVTVSVLDTVSINGAMAVKASENTDSPILPGPWEGHAGLHFFTRFPKGVTNPFIYGLPEGFVVNRHWYGQGGDHWTTTHDVRFNDGVISKKIVLVGSGFEKGSFMLWDGNKEKGNWIV